MTIRVVNTSAGAYEVTVEGATTTVHSLEFLLERESNTSILSAFDLPVIQRYFSEYERTIASALRHP